MAKTTATLRRRSFSSERLGAAKAAADGRTVPGTYAELAAAECANFVHGQCLSGNRCTVQVDGRCCYFEDAVLPLYPDLPPPDSTVSCGASRGRARLCAGCGVEFMPGSQRAKWCPACRAAVRREQTRKRVARLRSRRSVTQ